MNETTLSFHVSRPLIAPQSTVAAEAGGDREPTPARPGSRSEPRRPSPRAPAAVPIERSISAVIITTVSPAAMIADVRRLQQDVEDVRSSRSTPTGARRRPRSPRGRRRWRARGATRRADRSRAQRDAPRQPVAGAAAEFSAAAPRGSTTSSSLPWPASAARRSPAPPAASPCP